MPRRQFLSLSALIVARAMDAGGWLESVPGRPLEFRTIGQPR